MQAVFPKKRRNIYEISAPFPPSGSLESITASSARDTGAPVSRAELAVMLSKLPEGGKGAEIS